MLFNLKTASIFALAASAIALPALAQAETIERDGVTYEYSVKTEKNRTVITGKADRQTPFRLVVRGQRVSGEYNGKQVAFSLSEARANAAEVAVR
ncbi:hypothetical protein KRR38_24935 [Novosphingobium sp. G106]|uniref:hypothetical protein n=1 Tax=Novosphingobium sp. G106 TaxID=2849500 RepID=UPI001C2DED59|nr:hypothetical protein [Novosphingobium sp. G106]MBV1690834.1 hypothetical protein [Novosphingobium sp. G106]